MTVFLLLFSALRSSEDCELPNCSQTLVATDTCACIECVSGEDYILYDGKCHHKDKVFQDISWVESSHALLIQSEFLYSLLEQIVLTSDCGDDCEARMVELTRAASHSFFQVYQEKFDFLFILPYLPIPCYNKGVLGRMFRMEGVTERLLGTAILNMEPARYGDPYQNLHLIASYWGSRLSEPFVTIRGKGAWEVSGLNVAGQLGGWPMEDFECVDPLGATLSSVNNVCNTNEIRAPVELGGREHGDDSNPTYAKMELMLMGILDQEELENDNDYLIHCKDARLIDSFKIPLADVPFTINQSAYEWSTGFPQPSAIDPSFSGDRRIMNHYTCSDLQTFSPADISALVPDSSTTKLNRSTELTLGFMVLFPDNVTLTEGHNDDLKFLNLYLQNFSKMFSAATLGYASATTKLSEVVEVEIENKGGWVQDNITLIVVVVVVLFLICLTITPFLYKKCSKRQRKRKGYKQAGDG
jgi:hypothetical protein